MSRRSYRPRENGLFEDLAAIMGGTAALRLVAIFGGASLYVPGEALSDHPIARVVGRRPFECLVEAFGGDVLDLPACAEFDRLRRIRRVARLLAEGKSVSVIAGLIGCTERQVRNYRYAAHDLGLAVRRLPRD